ncbi:MAG: 1-acyl-sn-glycerol-3-phosphate acyltransferase [Phycisphaerae bacterium]|nr:1-acyl-sn-glycerol-3-phosphate acyltransferase [Phycisphaerae bacterium]
MIRNVFAIFVLFLSVIVLGSIVFLLGLIYPSRRIMAVGSNLWARIMLISAGVRLRVEGQEYLDVARPRFYVGNHQSAMDIPVMIAVTRGHVRFMAKDSLFRIPIFGWVLGRYGYIPINRRSARAAHRRLDVMIAGLKRHPISFVVFPEGTRSPDGRLLPFRMGTMKICQRAGMDVVPFAIEGSLAVHRRGQWRVKSGPVRVCLAEPIVADEVSRTAPGELHRRVLSAIESRLPPELHAPALDHVSSPEAVPAAES